MRNFRSCSKVIMVITGRVHCYTFVLCCIWSIDRALCVLINKMFTPDYLQLWSVSNKAANIEWRPINIFFKQKYWRHPDQKKKMAAHTPCVNCNSFPKFCSKSPITELGFGPGILRLEINYYYYNMLYTAHWVFTYSVITKLFPAGCGNFWICINSYSASHDNWCTVGGDGGCRVGKVRAGSTSPMPDHKGFKLQYLVNFQKFSTVRVNGTPMIKLIGLQPNFKRALFKIFAASLCK